MNCSTCSVLVLSAPGLPPVLIRGDPVETNLRKLISGYCAIQEVDRILREAGPGDETALIGLRIREMRRRGILLELTPLIGVAADL